MRTSNIQERRPQLLTAISDGKYAASSIAFVKPTFPFLAFILHSCLLLLRKIGVLKVVSHTLPFSTLSMRNMCLCVWIWVYVCCVCVCVGGWFLNLSQNIQRTANAACLNRWRIGTTFVDVANGRETDTGLAGGYKVAYWKWNSCRLACFLCYLGANIGVLRLCYASVLVSSTISATVATRRVFGLGILGLLNGSWSCCNLLVVVVEIVNWNAFRYEATPREVGKMRRQFCPYIYFSREMKDSD